MSYAIFKDYGYISEELLASGIKRLDLAIERARDIAETSARDDLIEVASFADDGEFIAHYATFGREEESDERLYDEF
jgi:hypothetical protein